MVRYPPLALIFTQAHLCDTPFCNISRDNCAIPHKNRRAPDYSSNLCPPKIWLRPCRPSTGVSRPSGPKTAKKSQKSLPGPSGPESKPQIGLRHLRSVTFSSALFKDATGKWTKDRLYENERVKTYCGWNCLGAPLPSEECQRSQPPLLLKY